MAVTIQQIADIAGVSRGTVDRALNNRGRIDPEVEKKIKQIANELGYVQKARKNTVKKIKLGIITQLCEASFMQEINRGILQAIEELKNMDIEVVRKDSRGVDEKEQLKAIDQLVTEKVDGIAMMPVDTDAIRTKINWLTEEKNIPVVTFNSDIVGTKRLCYVGMDNKQSGKAAAGLLGMLMRNEGKVLVITGYFSNLVNNMRVDGFVEEVKENYPGMEVAGVHSSFEQEEEVEYIVENALMNSSGIQGIFVVSSGQNGVKKALEKLQIEKRPHVIIYDQTPENEMLLNEGIADFMIDQNGYIQGWSPLHILVDFLWKKEVPKQERLYTDVIIKTKYNL